jgi:tetrahydromethanopterin S-methyltransferase subunit E
LADRIDRGWCAVFVATVNWGPIRLGWRTLWLDVHGLLTFLVLVFAAFLFGAIFFTKDPDARTVRRLKISAIGTFAALLALMITGMIPDTAFSAGSVFSGTIHNSYGAFTNHVSDSGLANFSGPLLFDMMEHVSLIVTGLAAVAGVLILHYGERVITVPVIRRSVLTLMGVTGIWTLVIGAIGVYLTKVLTFPVGS